MLPLESLMHENSPEIQQIKLVDGLKYYANKIGMSELAFKQKVSWILKFSQFHNRNHPSDLNQADIESFISSLATENHYNQSTQLRALSAIQFLYQEFLRIPLKPIKYIKNKERRSFADRFGDAACQSVVKSLNGSSQLMTELAIFGRLKLKQVVNIKLLDVDIKKNQIAIRRPNDSVNFIINIPIKLILTIRIQMLRARQLEQIKTQASTHVDSNPHNLQLPNHSEYLFSVANTSSPHITSKAMQLALLKNDIKIAYKNHLRYSSIKLPSLMMGSRRTNHQQIEHLSTPLFSTLNRRQSSFNFDIHIPTINNVNRMQELKQSVA